MVPPPSLDKIHKQREIILFLYVVQADNAGDDGKVF